MNLKPQPPIEHATVDRTPATFLLPMWAKSGFLILVGIALITLGVRLCLYGESQFTEKSGQLQQKWEAEEKLITSKRIAFSDTDTTRDKVEKMEAISNQMGATLLRAKDRIKQLDQLRAEASDMKVQGYFLGAFGFAAISGGLLVLMNKKPSPYPSTPAPSEEQGLDAVKTCPKCNQPTPESSWCCVRCGASLPELPTSEVSTGIRPKGFGAVTVFLILFMGLLTFFALAAGFHDENPFAIVTGIICFIAGLLLFGLRSGKHFSYVGIQIAWGSLFLTGILQARFFNPQMIAGTLFLAVLIVPFWVYLQGAKIKAFCCRK